MRCRLQSRCGRAHGRQRIARDVFVRAGVAKRADAAEVELSADESRAARTSHRTGVVVASRRPRAGSARRVVRVVVTPIAWRTAAGRCHCCHPGSGRRRAAVVVVIAAVVIGPAAFAVVRLAIAVAITVAVAMISVMVRMIAITVTITVAPVAVPRAVAISRALAMRGRAQVVVFVGLVAARLRV